MKNYYKFSVEEFVQDDYFRKWVLDELDPKDTFWTNWLELNPDKRAMIEDAKSLVIALKVKEIDLFTQDEIKDGIQHIMDDTRRKYNNIQTLSRNWLKIAATVTIIISAGFWLINKAPESSTSFVNADSKQQEAIHFNNGTKSLQFELSDGSKITLAPKSELRYGSAFGKEKREVILTGEAFFDVAKDLEKPFLIYTGKLVTKVVGTSFRIKAYKDDKNISVSVRTGKVTVYNQNSRSSNSNALSTEIVLIPNQKAVFEKDPEILVKTLVDKPVPIIETPQKISLVFEETKVLDVFEKLESIYGVQISIDNELFKKCSITADLQKETLYEKLDLICEIIQAQYEILDGEIMIYGKGCS
jgi:ferric-dicitrate binding protein FerR (iron transport regulator)